MNTLQYTYLMGHTAYRRALLINLYLHTKFHRNRKKNFVDGRTDRHLTHVIRSTLQTRPNKVDLNNTFE